MTRRRPAFGTGLDSPELTMFEDRSDSTTDAFLLTLDDRAILDVGAMIGLRARVTARNDAALIDAFLGSDAPFAKPRRPMLITSLPGIRPS